LNGNQVDRRPATLPAASVAGCDRIRRICRVIAPALITLFWAVAAMAVDAPNSRLADDVALTKATISSLAARDNAAVRDRFDPTRIQVSDETLRQMSDVIGASPPVSIETIWSTETHDVQTGDGNSRILFEYGLTGKWVVVDAVIKTEAASKRFTRLYLTVNTLPLRELNAFHLFGKGPMQYLFLAGWIAVIVFTAWAMTVAFRQHAGWRRWALIFLMPLGLTPTMAMNWNTAQVWVLEAINNPAGHSIPLFALRYPMALFGKTETLDPYLYVSAPLIALGYLIWRRRRSQRSQPLASRADQGN
jgi:hypothetical protein